MAISQVEGGTEAPVAFAAMANQLIRQLGCCQRRKFVDNANDSVRRTTGDHELTGSLFVVICKHWCAAS
jgi:hypothetical protein